MNQSDYAKNISDESYILTKDDHDEYIAALCDYTEWYQTMDRQFHGYANDPVDVDKEGWFVNGGAHHMVGWI